MKTNYRLAGEPPNTSWFYELCRKFQDSTPLKTTIVKASWPLGGNPKFGDVVQLNDELPFFKEMADVLAYAAKVELIPLSEKEDFLAKRLTQMEVELHNCREILKYIYQQNKTGNLTCTGLDMQKLIEAISP